MTDQRLIDHLQETLSRLNTAIQVSDRSILTNSPDSDILTALPDGVCQMAIGRVWLLIRRHDIVLSCQADVPNAEDLLILAENLILNINRSENETQNVYDVYRRALRGDLSNSEIQMLGTEYRIPMEMSRCVMVFQMLRSGDRKAFEILMDIVPLEGNDELIDIDRHTAVLIKDASDAESVNDLVEYATALQETLISETAHQMTVGIGEICGVLQQLHESYDSARKAIEIGRVFRPEENVYVFHSMILERLLSELPHDVATSYYQQLFNRRTARLFNEEMLDTIDMFFHSDLNLSDTARQLYVHRNTLVYRLDKIQKQTGLDLRHFDDAVTFRLLMVLKSCLNDNNK